MHVLERLPGVAGGILVLAVLCACPQENGAPARGPTSLDPTSPRHRLTLPRGETRRFEITLESGQYLQLRVDQLGVDLVVTLLDPEGRPLLQVDNPSGADGSQGPERVVRIAETSGRHTVTVEGLEGQSGDFEITVEALRTPDTADRRRAAAEASMARGDALYGQQESRRRSVEAYEEARAGFRALGERSREADAFYRIGRSWKRLGEHELALEVYGEALRIYGEAGAARQQAITLENLCSTEYLLLELTQAFGHCSRALPLWEQTGDLRGQALSSQNLALIHRSWGESREALKLYDQSLDVWRRLGDRYEQAITLHNRGRLYSYLGDREQALADLEESLRLRRELGKPDPVVALNSLGQLHRKWQEPDRAAELFEEALEMDGESSGYRKGISLAGLGQARQLRGELESAHALFQEALEIFVREGRRDWQARTYLDLGWLYESQGRTQDASAHFEQAQTLFNGLRDRSSEAEALLGLATVARRDGRLAGARRKVETALSMIEDLRVRTTEDSDQRAGFLAVRHRYDELYVDVLMEMGLDEEALAASERGQARSLREMLREIPGDLGRDVDPRLVQSRRDLERRIRETEFQLVRLRKTDPAEADVRRLEDEQSFLLREHERVQGRIRESHPRYAALTQPEPLEAAEIRQLLDESTLLLEYDLGEEKSYLWAVTSDSILSARLPPRSEIEGVARRAYDLIRLDEPRSQRRIEADLAHLSRLLLEPAAALLGEKKRLLVVGDGILRCFPFAALPVPAAPGLPLVASHEIVSLPSASTLAVLREQTAGRPPAPGTLAVVADPAFGSAPYPRLVHAAEEAREILALVAPEERLGALGAEANRDLFTSGRLSRYRIVHLATHAELNLRHPELSRLLLSLADPAGRPRDDGLLHAYEIYNLNLPAELVVLSACETALGKEVRGEGLIGLQRAFFYAGAARVVVSLWKVDDRSTAELMKRFYEKLLHEDLAPGEALRAAQDSIRRERPWQAPYHWAGFVLQGEWRDMAGAPPAKQFR